MLLAFVDDVFNIPYRGQSNLLSTAIVWAQVSA